MSRLAIREAQTSGELITDAECFTGRQWVNRVTATVLGAGRRLRHPVRRAHRRADSAAVAPGTVVEHG